MPICRVCPYHLERDVNGDDIDSACLPDIPISRHQATLPLLTTFYDIPRVETTDMGR